MRLLIPELVEGSWFNLGLTNGVILKIDSMLYVTGSKAFYLAPMSRSKLKLGCLVDLAPFCNKTLFMYLTVINISRKRLRKPVGATVNIYCSDRRYLINWRSPLNYLTAAT